MLSERGTTSPSSKLSERSIFHTGPNGIFETHCAFGHLHVSVGFVEGCINVRTVFFRHLEDLGEEKVEEVLVLIVAEVDEVEGFRT